MATQLEQEGIEITEMYALRSDDHHSFEMVMELTVPTGVNLSELERKLQDSDRHCADEFRPDPLRSSHPHRRGRR